MKRYFFKIVVLCVSIYIFNFFSLINASVYYNEVLQNNLEKHQEFHDPKDYLKVNDDYESFKKLSDEIVKGINDPYEKVLAIHDWICENVYYDYRSAELCPEGLPAFYAETEEEGWQYLKMTEYQRLTILKRGFCEDYALYFEYLVRSQNIPCISVNGIAVGGEGDGWTEEHSKWKIGNHAWNEVYINEKWINIDTTWDSSNQYTVDKQFIKGDIGHKYFDIEDNELAKTHKILEYDIEKNE